MIQITPVAAIDVTDFDYVKCPVCKTRLCNKSKDTEIHLLQLSGVHINKKINKLLMHCHKCKSKYLFSMEEN